MRSYGQYCAVARALDVVGNRWSLLVVRELLLRGPCRYTDLRDGLPGIATNLLADRLRELEEAGLVTRAEAPPPVATTLYELTERGSAVAPILDAFGIWGAELMARPQGPDEFRSHWLAFPLGRLTDNTPKAPAVTIQLDTGDQPMIVETVDGRVRARPGTVEEPDARLSGPAGPIVAVLRGLLDLDQAQERGLQFEGDEAVLHRIRPAPSPDPQPAD